jgi:hypothetical protein
MTLKVRIISLEHHGLADSGSTENVSPFGLKALVARKWQPNEPVGIESPPGVFRSRGWIVYCQPADRGEFVVGLRLLTPQLGWAPDGGKTA